jgi:hypothetical protein
VADQHDRNEHYHITRQDSFLYTIATTSIIRQQVDLGDQGADSKVQVTVRLKVPPPQRCVYEGEATREGVRCQTL